MDYFFVNSLIKNKNGQKMADLFKLDTNLEDIQSKKVYKPFGELFMRQQLLNKEKTYENVENVLKASISILEEGNYVYPILKTIINNCLMAINFWGSERNKESLAKVLFCFTKTSESYEIKYYTVNVLFQLYLEINKFGLLENLLLISENNRRGKKDYYVYNFYKGMVLFYTDKFTESFEAFKISFRSRKLKSITALPFFLCAILNGKIPKETSLNRYDCGCLIDLSQSIKFGLSRKVSSDIERLSDILIKNHLFRPCYTYLPLIAFCNLIKRLYYIFADNAKLEIEKIKEATNFEYLEIFSLLSSVIDFDMIKGYVSVNKGVVVFSKVDPFPNTFNL